MMKTTPRARQTGLTLIEIMVAITLGLVLMGGVIQMFLSSKQTYRVSEAAALLQQSGRFAIDTIARDLRMAGYQGCADPQSVASQSVMKNNSPTNNLTQTAVTGTEGNATPDGLVIQYASGSGVQLAGDTDSVNAIITVQSNPENIAANDVVMISDCSSAHIVQATDVAASGTDTNITYGDTANDLNGFTKTYTSGQSRVMRFNSAAYSVSDTGRTNGRGDKIFSLYRQELTDAGPVELVEGVEQLQMQFGERLTNGNVRFVDADVAGLDMSRVVSVRVGLLLAAVEATAGQDDEQSYGVAGTTVAPQGTAGATVTHPVDRRMRRAFTTTINLRNRR